jgi:hypothetical protein
MNNADISRPSYRSYKILHFGFSFLPIVAGLDKFFDIHLWSAE